MGALTTLREATSRDAIRGALRGPAAPQIMKRVPRGGANGPPLAEALEMLSPWSRLVEYGAIAPDPVAWFRVMERADTGDTGPMIDVFSDARDRDSHLDGITRKRVQSMMGRPIVVRPPDGYEDDAEANDCAQWVRSVLLYQSRSFRAQLTHLMTGAPYGYAVSTIRWATNRDGEWVPHLEWAHVNRFAFTRDTREIGYYEGTYRNHASVRALSDCPRDSFVVHMPMGGRSDYPWRRGPMRSCVMPSFIKRNGLQFWMTLAERFGMPQPFATVPAGIDDDGSRTDSTVANVKAALKNLSRVWSLVVSEGVKIDSIPGSGNVSAEVHKALIEWAEMTQSISVLGQNLTTKVEGGSFAAAESHRYVAGDIHLADATELGETITQQVVEPLIRYNRPGAPVPILEVSTGAKQVPTPEMVRDGIYSDDEIRRGMGHEAKPDGSGKDYRRPVLVAVPEQIGDAPAQGEPVAGEVIETEAPSEDAAVAKDASAGLNGAQIDKLLAIVTSVAQGQIPRASGLALIVAAFPLSDSQAETIMGTVGAGFVPKPEGQPAAPAPMGV